MEFCLLTLRRYIITLQMTMNEQPLLNEPGVNDKYKQSIEIYNETIYLINH